MKSIAFKETAEISLLKKTNPPNPYKSYCPLSILSSISQIIEDAVLKQLFFSTKIAVGHGIYGPVLD